MPSRREFLFHLDRLQRISLFITESGWLLKVGASWVRPGTTPGAAGGLPVDKGALIAEIAACGIALTPKAVCRFAALHERSGECWALCLALGGAKSRASSIIVSSNSRWMEQGGSG
ncbi:hypothetical protein [Citreimonas sp.]|uniref:hypothetical protein n=1 Tax=Citreimonas sp. TaxID=3036715 RepID=UPI004059EBDE